MYIWPMFVTLYIIITLCYVEGFSEKWSDCYVDSPTTGIFLEMVILSIFWPVLIIMRCGNRAVMQFLLDD